MDPLLSVLTNLGLPGVLAWILWIVLNRLVDTLKDSMKQLLDELKSEREERKGELQTIHTRITELRRDIHPAPPPLAALREET